MNFQEAHLIASIQTLLGHDEELTYFFFHHKRPEPRLASAELLADAEKLSRADYILIQAALDIWNKEGGLRLSEALKELDDSRLLALVRARLYFREVQFTAGDWC